MASAVTVLAQATTAMTMITVTTIPMLDITIDAIPSLLAPLGSDTAVQLATTAQCIDK